jgi:hypothetical protein
MSPSYFSSPLGYLFHWTLLATAIAQANEITCVHEDIGPFDVTKTPEPFHRPTIRGRGPPES